MNITYWKKKNSNGNVTGILVKQNNKYTCCVEINEDYSDIFILEKITYDNFVDICNKFNCLTVPEFTNPFPLSSSSSL